MDEVEDCNRQTDYKMEGWWTFNYKKCGEISLKDAEMVMIKAAYLPQIVKEVLY